jgi:hypothetical protein
MERKKKQNMLQSANVDEYRESFQESHFPHIWNIRAIIPIYIYTKLKLLFCLQNPKGKKEIL